MVSIQNQVHFEAGVKLANAPAGEEIVITGMSGRFPESDDVYGLLDNLLHKRDMVTLDDRRWDITKPGLPHRLGKINYLDKFDAGFFDIPYSQGHTMDPACKQLLERAVEAIFDAGLSLEEMKGSRTGVIVGNLLTDAEKMWYYDAPVSKGYAVLGCNRSMQAQRISRALHLNGPSTTMDTGSSSSLYALEYAYKQMRTGRCDNYIVCATNLCLQPKVTYQYFRLGALSADGKSKCFDELANGYVRSEAIAVILLQKVKTSKRIYAQVVHSKTNADGFKEKGPTYPAGIMQKALMDELYAECNVDPSTIDYLEAHATGTMVGDPEEVAALGEVFCANRKNPLLVGSLKSNIGHTEPASGLCSLVKVLLCMEHKFIPANLHFKNTKKGLEAIENGKLVVVTANLPWPENPTGLVAINNLGIGGANAHALFKHLAKTKLQGGKPADNLPRIVCVSGRTAEAVAFIMDDLSKRSLDCEFVRLFHDLFKYPILEHPYRGYTILSKTGELHRNIKYFVEQKQPLCLFIGNLSDEFLDTAEEFLSFPHFANTFESINKILMSQNINILEVIKEKKRRNTTQVILTKVALQMAFVKFLTSLSVNFNKIIGHHSGEIAATCCDNDLSLEEAVFLSYYLTQKQFTVSNGIDKTDINKVKPFYSKQNENDGKYIFSNEIQQKLVNLKTQTQVDVPSEMVVVNIGSEHLEDKTSTCIKLINSHKSKPGSNIEIFLRGLGELYNAGYDMHLEKLYPAVQYPVSSGTPMISPLIKWNHSVDWFVPRFSVNMTKKLGEQLYKFIIQASHWKFMTGHVIDGRNLVPATAYLYMVWETLSLEMGVSMLELKVKFEDVRFLRATSITKTSTIDLSVTIQKLTGIFEVVEQNHLVISGRILALKEEIEIPSIQPHENGLDDNPSLLTNDFYKELSLRGYNYEGAFQGVRQCNVSITKALIEWKNNWIAFIDNMLQVTLLSKDNRNLYVPISIEELFIDPIMHMQYVEKLGEDPVLPVYLDRDCQMVKSGGIELRGLLTSSIAKRKNQNEPVLQSYSFVPFEVRLESGDSLRVIAQLIQENSYVNRLRVVEVIENTSNILITILRDIFADIPAIQSELVVLSKEKIQLNDLTVKQAELSSEKNSSALVIGSKLLNKPKMLQDALNAINEHGMILSRENKDFKLDNLSSLQLEVIMIHELENEKFLVFKKSDSFDTLTTIDVTNCTENFQWLPQLQEALKSQKKVVLFAQNEPTNGILGFVNCLKCEPGCSSVRCFFIMDNNVPKFDLNNSFYSNQLKKGLSVNVFKSGSWGTYRHLCLPTLSTIKSEHVYNTVTARGNLSSFKWFQGHLSSDIALPLEKELVYIHYSALNFRDVMTATGRINNDVITTNRLKQSYIEGIEFSGKTKSGKRVMGVCNGGGLATMFDAEKCALWAIPDILSLEDAATMPIAYATVLYAFRVVAKIRPGQSILIHVGSGAVGQAALNVALYYKCQVFTTVGSLEKREFIKTNYPEIVEDHIGYSRDLSFETMVLNKTNGRGVDIVLNSLAEEKLLASLRCLAKGGHFLEIGKFDLISNHFLALEMFNHGCSFSGIMLDSIFTHKPETMKIIGKLIEEGLNDGYVKPIKKVVFEMNEVEEAYKFMAAAKHLGKVVIKIRGESQKENSVSCLYDGLPRFYCDPTKSYVINGGLGGFGLELADWLVLRGAKKLLLISRIGIQSGYQALRLKSWKSHNVSVNVCTAKTTTREGCIAALFQASTLGPVEGIFNLAVVLADNLFESLDEENFLRSLEPKAVTTRYLDELSRKMCPELKYFVGFSSMSSGRGNAGQTNYGLGNSIIERICEERRRAGFPGIAVQWGTIGDVGLVAEAKNTQNKNEIAGTLAQPISSCLEVLETLLKQNEYSVISSMVVAEKKSDTATTNNIVDTVRIIMGLKNLKGISVHTTFPQLGMDSIMAVEIRQTLEREFGVFLTAQEIRNMTYANLYKIMEKSSVDGNSEEMKMPTQNKYGNLDILRDVYLLLPALTSDKNAKIPVVKMNSKLETDIPLLILPGIDGMAFRFESLAENFKFNTFCLQLPFCSKPEDSIEKIARKILPQAKKIIEGSKTKNVFKLVAFSFGTVVATELTHLLELEGFIGNVVLIDGSAAMFRNLIRSYLPQDADEDTMQTVLLAAIMKLYVSFEVVLNKMDDIFNCKTLKERVEFVVSCLPKEGVHSEQDKREMCSTLYARLNALATYIPNFEKLRSNFKLIKPTEPIAPTFDHSYKIEDICHNFLGVSVHNGNHLTVLKNLEVANKINALH